MHYLFSNFGTARGRRREPLDSRATVVGRDHKTASMKKSDVAVVPSAKHLPRNAEKDPYSSSSARALIVARQTKARER